MNDGVILPINCQQVKLPGDLAVGEAAVGVAFFSFFSLGALSAAFSACRRAISSFKTAFSFWRSSIDAIIKLLTYNAHTSKCALKNAVFSTVGVITDKNRNSQMQRIQLVYAKNKLRNSGFITIRVTNRQDKLILRRTCDFKIEILEKLRKWKGEYALAASFDE